MILHAINFRVFRIIIERLGYNTDLLLQPFAGLLWKPLKEKPAWMFVAFPVEIGSAEIHEKFMKFNKIVLLDASPIINYC